MNQAVFPVQSPSGHRFDALRRWEAQLRLELVAHPSGEGRRTELYRNQARGPLHVQRPFWPEGPSGACHLYLLHPPGGLVSGDALTTSVCAGPHTRSLITTPSANRLYRADRHQVPWSQYTRLNVAEGAIVEYLPQETIAFDGTRGHQHLRMDVASGGTVIGWELLGLGRPAGEQPFVSGAFTQQIELWQDGEPIWLERQVLDPAAPGFRGPWGLAGQAYLGTLWAFSEHLMDAHVSALRDALPEATDWGVTLRAGVLILRYRGTCRERGWQLFNRAWALLRPALTGHEAHPPRIWKT